MQKTNLTDLEAGAFKVAENAIVLFMFDRKSIFHDAKTFRVFFSEILFDKTEEKFDDMGAKSMQKNCKHRKTGVEVLGGMAKSHFGVSAFKNFGASPVKIKEGVQNAYIQPIGQKRKKNF